MDVLHGTMLFKMKLLTLLPTATTRRTPADVSKQRKKKRNATIFFFYIFSKGLDDTLLLLVLSITIVITRTNLPNRSFTQHTHT